MPTKPFTATPEYRAAAEEIVKVYVNLPKKAAQQFWYRIDRGLPLHPSSPGHAAQDALVAAAEKTGLPISFEQIVSALAGFEADKRNEAYGRQLRIDPKQHRSREQIAEAHNLTPKWVKDIAFRTRERAARALYESPGPTP